MSHLAPARRAAWALLAAAAALVGLASWLFGELGVIRSASEAVDPLAFSVQESHSEPQAFAATPEPAAAAAAKPADPAAPSETPAGTADQHPHPITPRRVALQRELQLIAALNDALDLRDAASMRNLLADYRVHDPRDENNLQSGYACLIDCLEAPGEASRAAAQAYYDAYRASTLRRFIRRICLE